MARDDGSFGEVQLAFITLHSNDDRTDSHGDERRAASTESGDTHRIVKGRRALSGKIQSKSIQDKQSLQ